jgi:hypothetical protein
MNEPMTPAVARPSLVQGLVHDAGGVFRSKRNPRALVAVAAVALAAVLALGYLLTRSPSVHSLASFSAGRATLSINGGSANVLSLLTQGSTLASRGGAGLTWQSADGWYLNLNGPFSFDSEAPTSQPAPAAAGAAAPGPVPLDANGSFQLNGADFGRWAGIDSNACAIVYTEVATTRIAGSITCRGLVWYDKSSVEHVQPVDVPPFDLNVNFEATGDGRPPANP